MGSAELEIWKNLLQHTVGSARQGMRLDSACVLDEVASVLMDYCKCPIAPSTRVADLILSSVDFAEAKSLPDSILDFVNDTLVSTYPVSSTDAVPSLWLMRSLTRILDTCPLDMLLDVLKGMKRGLCTWISDHRKTLTLDDWSMDVRTPSPYMNSPRLTGLKHSIGSSVVSDNPTQPPNAAARILDHGHHL